MSSAHTSDTIGSFSLFCFLFRQNLGAGGQISINMDVHVLLCDTSLWSYTDQEKYSPDMDLTGL